MKNDQPLLSGRYRLEDKIATGGMGTVYRAVDERLRRAVAVKLLKEHLVGDERALERFRREARGVASLTHPNIAVVFDYGEEAGRHFIVMELVEGQDLAAVLRNEGALGFERAPRIAIQVCDALSASHALGIVHRDIKPGNVLIGNDDHVKVTDFGIARAADDGTLTVSGMFLGTATYVAPEVAEGSGATPSSDIYSLGVVLFEMLTGFPPFEADSAVAVALMHANEEVPLPSTRRPDIPKRLDDAVRRATAKDPADRFGSTEEFAGHLRMQDTQVDAPTVSSFTAGVVQAETTLTDPSPSDSEGGATADVSRGERRRSVPRALLIGLGLILVILFVGVMELTSSDPPKVQQRETRDRGSPGVPELPSPLESALDELDSEVGP